jgi:hypothetical protein
MRVHKVLVIPSIIDLSSITDLPKQREVMADKSVADEIRGLWSKLGMPLVKTVIGEHRVEGPYKYLTPGHLTGSQ